jgi:hypothetical protein
VYGVIDGEGPADGVSRDKTGGGVITDGEYDVFIRGTGGTGAFTGIGDGVSRGITFAKIMITHKTNRAPAINTATPRPFINIEK